MAQQVEISTTDAQQVDNAFRAYLAATVGGVILRDAPAMRHAFDAIARPAIATWDRLTGNADHSYATDLETVAARVDGDL